MANPVSSAKIAGHPLHPMLIPFSVAFLVGALASDLTFWGTTDGFWARVSVWLIGAAIVMALLAAVAGFTDFLGERRIRSLSDARKFPSQNKRRGRAGHPSLGPCDVLRRRRHPAVHRLEGLADGLSPPRRHRRRRYRHAGRAAFGAAPRSLNRASGRSRRIDPLPRRDVAAQFAAVLNRLSQRAAELLSSYSTRGGMLVVTVRVWGPPRSSARQGASTCAARSSRAPSTH